MLRLQNVYLAYFIEIRNRQQIVSLEYVESITYVNKTLLILYILSNRDSLFKQ